MRKISCILLTLCVAVLTSCNRLPESHVNFTNTIWHIEEVNDTTILCIPQRGNEKPFFLHMGTNTQNSMLDSIYDDGE